MQGGMESWFVQLGEASPPLALVGMTCVGLEEHNRLP